MALARRAPDTPTHPLLARILAARSPEERRAADRAAVAAIDHQRRLRVLTKKTLRLFEVPYSEWDCFEDLADVLAPLGLHLGTDDEVITGFPDGWTLTISNPYGVGTNALLVGLACAGCRRTIALPTCLRLWEIKAAMRAHRCGETAR